MLKELADWMAKNPSPTVILALLLVSLVFSVLGLVVAQWLKPKLAELVDVQKKAVEIDKSLAIATSALDDLKSQGLKEEIGNLKGRVGNLEAVKSGDQEVLALKLKSLEESVAQALAELDALEIRSESEIVRIQGEAARAVEAIQKESKQELVRLNSIERSRLALEQAEQDLQLATIRELLARMNEARHPDAVARVQIAQARVEASRAQSESLGIQIPA